MDIHYTCKQSRPADQRWPLKGARLLTVSSRGHLAFTATSDLSRYSSGSHLNTNVITYHVLVADSNVPYEPYTVCVSDAEITLIEWDPSGTKLLVCDAEGMVEVWTPHEYLISDYRSHFKHYFPGEQFLTGLWYHPGIVTVIQNHGAFDYNEKFNQSNFGASLRLLGGRPAEGVVIVSSTGLVSSITFSADGASSVALQSVDVLRTRVQVADFAYCKNGGFLMATSDGRLQSMISIHKIELCLSQLGITDSPDMLGSGHFNICMTCRPHASFHPNFITQISQELKSPKNGFERITNIRFTSRDCSNEIAICIGGKNLSLIELWELEKRTEPKVRPTISAFYQNSSNGKDIKSEQSDDSKQSHHMSWIFRGNYVNSHELTAISSPRQLIHGQGVQANLLYLAFSDHNIHVVSKDSLKPTMAPIDLSDQQLCFSKTFTNYRTLSGLTTDPTLIDSMNLSPNQYSLFAIDSSSQLFLIRMPPLVEFTEQHELLSYQQTMLEYCFVTGNDWCDIMISIPRGSIMHICDRLLESFQMQAQQVQQKYLNRQLTVRGSLYRCLNTVEGICESTDCHALIMLNSISTTLKSFLRGKNTLERDSPAEYLSNFLKNQGSQPPLSNDLSTIVQKLNYKEFAVDNSAVQSLQQLNQWVVELAIYLMVVFPQKMRNRLQLPGAGLASDPKALETLRELLIIIKIWSLLNEQCSPVIHKLNEQFDVIANLFKLVSRVSSCINNNEPHDDALLDECHHLTNLILVPQFQLVLNPTGITNPLVYESQLLKNKRLRYPQFEYYVEPIVQLHEKNALAKIQPPVGSINMNGGRKIDVVRHTSLGAYTTANLRRCTRCDACSLIKPSFRTTRSWEQRWISGCVCGGSWTHVQNPTAEYRLPRPAKIANLGRGFHQ